MEFITGKCPECEGELQIPAERERIICMYCGADIAVQQTQIDTGQAPASAEENSRRYDEQVKKALDFFPQMLFSIEDPLKNFKKSAYEKAFHEYEALHQEAMEAIEDAYRISKSKNELLHQLVAPLVETVNCQLAEKKNKRQKDEVIMNYNMSLVVYLNPALIHHNRISGTPLVEELLRQWKESFPATNLKPSTFETINGGFKRRFCYITTAVCECLGKPDDCYELTLLRNYRDGYLQVQEHGEELVKRYYDVAPTIVKRINKSGVSHKVYENIWKEYLSPCIQLIEEDKNEKCMVLYAKMVDDLANQYFKQEEKDHGQRL